MATDDTLAPASGLDVALLGEQAAALEALEALATRADAHEHAARSARTRALYAADWDHFTRWCALAGHPPLPAGVDTLRWYLSDLEAARDETGARLYQPATLARRLAAIAAAHRDTGRPSPTRDPRVRAVLSGITRTRRHTPHRMQPLHLSDLRTILAGMEHNAWPAGVTAARDTFALLAGYAGALRRCELAALTVADLTRHPTDGIHVRIRISKTDQEGLGATVVLPFGQHPGTCPPCAWLRWAQLLAARHHGRQALMRAVYATPPWAEWTHLCGTPDPTTSNDPNEIHTDMESGQGAGGSRLAMPELPGQAAALCAIRKGGRILDSAISGDGLHAMVKHRAAAARLPGPIGFHSLRAGFVTDARRAGADTRAVRRQTRHSCDAMVELYDRDHAPLLGNAVTTLGL